MKHLKLDINNDIATLTFDMRGEKANKLSFAVLAELESVLDDLKTNRTIKALVIDSAKETIFIAGADIKEIEAMQTEEEVYQKITQGDGILNKLDELEIPNHRVYQWCVYGWRIRVGSML